jgi:transposase
MSEAECWQGIEAELNWRSMRIYQLEPTTVRMDATTVSGTHLVTEEGIFQFGYSKDDPDLAQIKIMMGSLDPLGMPMATQVVSGEQADDNWYIRVFEQSRASLAAQDLLWVGDCKMGSLATRSYIHHQWKGKRRKGIPCVGESKFFSFIRWFMLNSNNKDDKNDYKQPVKSY